MSARCTHGYGDAFGDLHHLYTQIPIAIGMKNIYEYTIIIITTIIVIF